MGQRPIEILLVEDSAADVWLISEALKQGTVAKNVNLVSNGEQALDFLRKRGAYSSALRPDLVLLDLNLPRRDGLEVLRELKSDSRLKTIPVIVLTSSEAGTDINAAYDLNANCYMVKPIDLEQFTLAIRGIEEFWMHLASLPTYTPQSNKPEQRTDNAKSAPSTGSTGSKGHRDNKPRTQQDTRRRTRRFAARPERQGVAAVYAPRHS
ncbi:MAG TPA: response regulator [Bryobacteraceae bacterium]|nr:response regulator [Bryobacteraceae bacterium]